MMKKILIVEDEEYLADMYKMKFEHEGYDVQVAVDGETGIELANSLQPDLILLDIVLPKMNGFQVMRTLREHPKTKRLKVYFLSNLGQDEEIEQGMKEGADGFLIKTDVTPAQLVECVEKIFAGETVGVKKKPFMEKVA